MGNRRQAAAIRILAAAMALAPGAVMAQSAFTYTATDYQTQLVTTPAPMSYQVRTVIIIAAGAGFQAAHISGPTKDIALKLRPPQGAATLLQITLGSKIVETKLRGSNTDGELETLAALPVSMANDAEIKVEWKANDGSVIESTFRAGDVRP